MRKLWRIVAVLAIAPMLGVVSTLDANIPAAYAAPAADQRGALEGYTLIASQTAPETVLIDMNGEAVHSWTSDTLAGLSAELLDDGSLMRTARVPTTPAPFVKAAGGQGGRVEKLAWDGKVVWSVDYASEKYLQHHDAEVLPNGNVLMLAWDLMSAAEAVAAGRDPGSLSQGELWPDSVVEMNPKTDEVVWEWHVRDHLVQNRDPAKPDFGVPSEQVGRIDLNYAPDGGQASWNHLNSIDYDPKSDQILMSSRQFSEVWIIDHDMTTSQAKGPRGDLQFRWGNPAAYGGGDVSDRSLFFQHDAQWIGSGLPSAGNILVFSNGDSNTRPYSTVEEFKPVRKNGRFVRQQGTFKVDREKRLFPKSTSAPDQLFAPFISGAQRLENGNLLVTDGPTGHVLEVTPKGKTVWTYDNEFFVAAPVVIAPSGFVIRPERLFRALRYAKDFKGFEGKRLVAAKTNPGSY